MAILLPYRDVQSKGVDIAWSAFVIQVFNLAIWYIDRHVLAIWCIHKHVLTIWCIQRHILAIWCIHRHILAIWCIYRYVLAIWYIHRHWGQWQAGLIPKIWYHRHAFHVKRPRQIAMHAKCQLRQCQLVPDHGKK